MTNLSGGGSTLYDGKWMLVRWGTQRAMKFDIDQRCRKCNDKPFFGALAWINLTQPYIYCQSCFDLDHV